MYRKKEEKEERDTERKTHRERIKKINIDLYPTIPVSLNFALERKKELTREQR